MNPPYRLILLLVTTVTAGASLMLEASLTHAEVPAPPKHPVTDENGVDVQSGTTYYPHTELSLGGDGIGALSYIRYYYGSSYGSNFDSSFIFDGYSFSQQSVNVIYGRANESFAFIAATEPTGSTVLPDDGAATGDYFRKDGLHVRFGYQMLYSPPDSGGHANGASVADYAEFANGVRWTYHYKQYLYAGITYYRIQSITSNAGYQLKYYYASNAPSLSGASGTPWAQVTKVAAINNAYEYCDPTADSCVLSLAWPQVQDSLSGSILTVTGPTGRQSKYTSGSAFTSVRTPGSLSDNIIYNWVTYSGPCYPGVISCATPRVASATIGGRTTGYSYTYNSSSQRWIVTTLDALGGHDVYKSVPDMLGGLLPGIIQHADPLGNTYSFTYDAAANVLSTTSPEGNSFVFTRDGNGDLQQTTIHAKAGSGLADLTESQVGPDNAPTSKTDARGNTTSYTYQFAGPDGVLTETGPADASGIRPAKRYAYAQRYAWVKTSAGSYVHAPAPIWVRTEERTCRQTATVGGGCAGGAGDEVVTTYDYGPDGGPNNLLLRGKVETADGVSLRTCYGYDIYGNKISETSPRAGLASCL